MVERHFKLRLLLQMAPIAELGLLLDQQKFSCLGMVGRMAGNTTDVILRVFRADRVHLLRTAGVAGHTRVFVLLGGVSLENKDLCNISPAGNVSRSGAMAGFAALVRWTAFRIQCGLPVRRLFPSVIKGVVAGFADLRTHIGGFAGNWWRR